MHIDEALLSCALKHYGIAAQAHKAVEELTELSLAVQHYRAGKATEDALAEEIADVLIMCHQLRLLMPNEVDAWLERKQQRLMDRIAGVQIDGE